MPIHSAPRNMRTLLKESYWNCLNRVHDVNPLGDPKVKSEAERMSDQPFVYGKELQAYQK